MSGRPPLHHSLQPENPSVPNDDTSFIAQAGTGETDASPSISSEPVIFDTPRDDILNPRGTSRIAGEQFANAKVAIPRLDLPVANHNGRVSRACHNCRKQKNKCSGHQPSCLRCQETNVPCVYVDGKRERNARHLTVVTSQLEHYESLLRDIYPKFDLEVARYVDQALGKISSLSLSSPTATQVPDDTIAPPAATCRDHTLEDFNGDVSLQATGYVGEHSARVWLHRLSCHIASTTLNIDNPSDQPSHPPFASCDFFSGDNPVYLGDDLDVAAYPSQAIADALVERYFQVLHASFPFIGKGIFLSQCRSFYSTATLQPGNKWMALLNMVFAIAAKHSEMTGDHQRLGLDHKSHTVYFSRAWKLNMNEKVMLEHPNLQQTQIEGLMSLYLLSIGQANRAWRICGIAIQSAVVMGIHLRNDNPSINHVSKETRYRLWWALYLLDILVCLVTGRMPRMQREHCTTPLPVPYQEESFWDEQVKATMQDSQARARLVGSLLSYNPLNETDQGFRNSGSPNQQSSPGRPQVNVSSYLLWSIDLAAVVRDAMEILYSPEAARKSATETAQAMKSLNNTADNWFSRLPAAYRLMNNGADNAFARHHTSLAFQYYSTKLVISHPALCFLIRDEDNSSALFHQIRTFCFNAAAQMIDLLPSQPDITWLLGYSPWWCSLHYLTQSTVVLITQLLTESEMRANQSTRPFERIQKALMWLRELSTRDPTFQRALDIFTDLLTSQGFNVGLG